MSATTSTPRRPAADYPPGAVFEGLQMRSTFIELSEEAFVSETVAGSGASGGPLHRHVNQEERFEVLEGALNVRLGLRTSRVVSAGESVVIPADTPHTFSVVGESARFIATFTPPLRVADYFLELFELEEPKLTDIARMAQEYPAEHFYLPLAPPRLQRALLRPFARG